MHRLVALLVLAPALAVAQPSAADSALVDEVIEVLRVEESLSTMMGPMSQGGMPGMVREMIDVGSIEDSLRAHLMADLRPDALRDARAFLTSPAHAEALAFAARSAEVLSDPGAMAAFEERLANPKKGALADEALTRRYVRALGFSERVPEMMRRMFTALAEAVPALAEEMEAEGGLDAALAQFEDQLGDDLDSTQVIQMRVALYGYPESALADAITFYESDAGQYLNDASARATMDVMIPAMVEFMAEMYTAFSEVEDEGDDIQIVEIEDAPPPPPAEGEPEIFEVVEVQPELIGGLEGLQERVLYPEAARRGGIEGQVVIQFVVDETGTVIDPVVLRSPDDLLSEAALAAVVGSRFTPGMQDGQPVRVRFAVPVTFRLRDPVPPKGKAGGQ